MSEYEPGTSTRRDGEVLAALRASDGCATEVQLRDGRSLRVWNVAWGYDAGDSWAHITTNISPSVTGEQVDYFYSHQVDRIAESDSGRLLLGPEKPMA
jgi:hypothetical protein